MLGTASPEIELYTTCADRSGFSGLPLSAEVMPKSARGSSSKQRITEPEHACTVDTSESNREMADSQGNKNGAMLRFSAATVELFFSCCAVELDG